MNDITTTIFYNKRIILSAPIETPITWHCSKVEQTSPKGCNRLTFAQEEFDQHKDAFEYEDGTFSSEYYKDKKVIGMWADYYTTDIPPINLSENKPIQKVHGEIKYASLPQIKVGGSYKKFTLNFYDEDASIDTPKGFWNFEIDNNDATELINTVEDENVIKIKFLGTDEWIGKIMKIKYTTDTGIETSVDVEIIGL